MDVRTVISSHSFQVTHADIRLVSSQTTTVNLNIEVDNMLLEGDSHYNNLSMHIHTKISQLYSFKFIFTDLKLHQIIKGLNPHTVETETVICIFD